MSKLVSSLTNGVAVAHQSGAMEAETIFKNGRRSKSQMSRGHILTYFVVVAIAVSAAFTSCKKNGGEDDNGKDNGVVQLLETIIVGSSPGYVHSIKFEYDSENRITKILDYYDGKPEMVQTFTYNGADLVKSVYESSEDYGNMLRTTEFVKNGNKITVTNDVNDITMIIDLNSDGTPAKITSSGEGLAREVTYDYQGGNIMKYTNKRTWEGETYESIIGLYKYDTKKSPFIYCKTPIWWLSISDRSIFEEGYFGLKNNVTEMSSVSSGENDGKLIITYEYDTSNFPTQMTLKQDGNEHIIPLKYITINK